jgi:hypothetical protein
VDPLSTEDSITKHCAKCGEDWPASRQFFHRHWRTKDGLRKSCKACDASPELRELVLASMLAPAGYNVCIACLEQKPFDAFEPKKLKCRACRNARWREWRDENHEALNERRRENYSANREEIREQKRIWREANRKRINEQQRRWRVNNPGYWKKWATRNREKARAAVRKRRRLRHAAAGEINSDIIWQMYDDQGGLCAYCEEPLFGTFHADHMLPLSRGGADDWSNIAVACPRCNHSKNKLTTEEFVARAH